MPTLSLQIDGLAVAFTVFASNGHERLTPDDGGKVDYSLNGTPINDGNLYESKHVWTIAAYTNEAGWRSLDAIYRRSERKRRTQQDPAILVFDYVRDFVEDSARTRALAPGGTETAIDGGGVSYPAQYRVRLFQPKFTPSGNGLLTHLVNFVMGELDKVGA